MKESYWEECVENNKAIRISPDKAKARALIETANAIVKFASENKLTEENARFILEAYYSSILEMAHSLLLLNGFKVDNHVCIGYYLRDVLKREGLFRIFDDCRYERNSVLYYGKKIDFEIAKESINKMTGLIDEFSLMLKKKV